MFECLDADPATLTGAELSSVLSAAHRDRNRADAAECRHLAEWDARQVWAADGALSGAAWLRNRLGVAAGPARERLRVGRRLRSMPLTDAVFEAGELSYEKVRLLARARTDATAELFDRDEPMLVDSGRVLDTDQFAKVVRYWQAMADAAGFAKGAKAKYDGRYASASELLDGMLKVDALFDPEVSRVVKGVLDEIVDELRRADRRDAASGVGAPQRTPGQLLADAFGEMARRAAANSTTRSRTEMMVLVPVEVLTDEPDQTPETPETDETDGTTDMGRAGGTDGPIDVNGPTDDGTTVGRLLRR